MFMNEMKSLDELLNLPVVGSTMPRWERKKLQAKKETPVTTPSKKTTKTPSKTKTPGGGNKTPLGRKTPGKEYGDRFIPNREMNSGKMHPFNNENSAPQNCAGVSDPNAGFKNKLAQSLFEGDDINSKILAFKKKAPKPTGDFQNSLRVLYTQNKEKTHVNRKLRHIAPNAERILDAPDLLDDYYLNLLDWGPTNILAVGLGSCVYLWDAGSGEIELLFENEEGDHVTSVSWMCDGSHLAVGMSNNDVQLWDVEKKKLMRTMRGHVARVGALAWNSHVLSSGSRDSAIFHHDVRIAQHHISTLQGHTQEICGLKWSPDGTQLASGGNDNLACIWDVNSTTPRHILNESAAAVKALAWCPFEKNLLATGSGTADRHIRFYNTLTGSVVNQIDTQSQVCSLQWSKTEKEILSAHGFSQNQLTVWKYPSLVKVAELTGHTARVLHTAVSADGTTVCSAAADETLRFWKVWEPNDLKRTKSTKKSTKSSSALNMKIR